MPGLIMDFGNEGRSEGFNSTFSKESPSIKNSQSSPLSPKNLPSECVDPPLEGCIDTSIEQLYDNVCEMQSSVDGSASRLSFLSYGEESRIDSELQHLVGGETIGIDSEEDYYNEYDIVKNIVSKENGFTDGNFIKEKTAQSPIKNSASMQPGRSRIPLSPESSIKLSPKSKIVHAKTSMHKKNYKISPKPVPGCIAMKKQRSYAIGGSKTKLTGDPSELGQGNPDLGPFLLKLARDSISSGDNPQKALELALRAATSFEKCADGKPSLELVMCLHVIAAIHCSLGQYSRAIPVIRRSIQIPNSEEGQEHALAKFSGYMQLGDTFASLGQLQSSLQCYTEGLKIQKQVLGEKDPRVAETCRYMAEAHVQALQFDEAKNFCQLALDIHRENGTPGSLEEAADRRLMGLICHTKGDHEAALEHLVLASMAMASNGMEKEIAAVDCSIGDAYLSMCRYEEAAFTYQKALTVFKSIKGENHPAVATVFVHLADLYEKTGKLREARSYCENALRIFDKPSPGTPAEDIASGLTDVAGIYESLGATEQALDLLHKALKIYGDTSIHQNTTAGIEAQMGVMYYMIGRYAESYASFKNAIEKLQASGENKSAFFGVALNQMGLACVQRYAINEAADLFEEARTILEQQYGPYHPDTLGVYSNLAGVYDAMGRLDDAIEILQYIVGISKEKLEMAHLNVDDEKSRLAELLKEVDRVRNRKS